MTENDKRSKYLKHCLLQLGKGMGGQKFIAEELGITVQQIRRWELGKAPIKKRDFRALRDLMREERRKGTKSAAKDQLVCRYCNKEIQLKKVGNGRYTAYHSCRSGLVVKLPERSREEAVRAFAPVVSEIINK